MPLSNEQHNLFVDCKSFLETDREKLSKFEIGFFEDEFRGTTLLSRYEEYGQDLQLSEKQIAVLQRMYDKVVNGIKPQFGGR